MISRQIIFKPTDSTEMPLLQCQSFWYPSWVNITSTNQYSHIKKGVKRPVPSTSQGYKNKISYEITSWTIKHCYYYY